MKKAINQSTLTSVLNIASIAAIWVALFACIGIVIVNVKRTDQADLRFKLAQDANNFCNASAYLTDQARSYAVTGDKHHYDNYLNEVNTLRTRNKSTESLRQLGITIDEQAKLDEMIKISDSLVPIETKAMEYASNGKTIDAVTEVYGEYYDEQISKIQIMQKEFTEMINIRTLARVDNLEAQATAMWIFCFSIFLIVMVLQGVAFAVTKYKVIKPVIEIEKQMHKISQGNLSAEFNLIPDTSEMGRLINAIIQTKQTLQSYIGDISAKLTTMAENDMNIRVELDYIGDFAPIKIALVQIVDSLNDTLSQIHIAADQVSSGAEQVSDGAQALSQGATEQASSVEQLSAAIAEISERIRESAQNSAHANKTANQAGDLVIESNREMQELMVAISDISTKSNEISKIIKTIDDIAFQTNILALNAAVEAARAGAAGKGFAVVADEVRNLSGKSAEAAQNTTILIEDSIRAVEAGLAIANKTANSMGKTVKMAEGVVASIEKISEASSEQAVAMGQVSQGIEQISGVVQTNSATAEESAAASEELSGQSQMLKDISAKFKLREEF